MEIASIIVCALFLTIHSYILPAGHVAYGTYFGLLDISFFSHSLYRRCPYICHISILCKFITIKTDGIVKEKKVKKKGFSSIFGDFFSIQYRIFFDGRKAYMHIYKKKYPKFSFGKKRFTQGGGDQSPSYPPIPTPLLHA